MAATTTNSRAFQSAMLCRRSTPALFRQLRRTDDVRVRDLLAERFLPLAKRLARRYHSGAEPLEDLVQVASLALLKAIDRYDVSREVSFSSYAIPTISGELKRHFRDNGWAVHVPRGMQEQALAVQRASRKASEQTGREPTVAELADRTRLDAAEVISALETYGAMGAASLDAPIRDGEHDDLATWSETIGVNDNGYELAEARVAIAPALSGLSRRDSRVLRMRFFEDRTQADIASRIGVSQMQVSRILRRTLDHLQATTEPSGLTQIAA